MPVVANKATQRRPALQVTAGSYTSHHCVAEHDGDGDGDGATRRGVPKGTNRPPGEQAKTTDEYVNGEDRNWGEGARGSEPHGSAQSMFAEEGEQDEAEDDEGQTSASASQALLRAAFWLLGRPRGIQSRAQFPATAPFWVTSYAEVSGSSSRGPVMAGNTVGGIAEGSRNGECSFGVWKRRDGRATIWDVVMVIKAYTIPLLPRRLLDGRMALISIGIGMG
ncbi:uncharacterized protein BP5553_02335 [Venustampulla echinocandica]|uniref:Uncharacterized protein n=1 Tax=Venustampulla echinocandica TaxID=2656787 RepID=A0A370U3K4_9HELO|nr:uncharacterized protein BP5553_02335 [Venustampulla echinocandica]RDL42356.1 hypothetical protein BP5553_02335 [Venustampulla echinocandica]